MTYNTTKGYTTREVQNGLTTDYVYDAYGNRKDTVTVNNRRYVKTYDAWGQQTVTTNTLNFHRGYTGHEHLSQFSLINMNGRMYDPLLGRFLSPDPFV